MNYERTKDEIQNMINDYINGLSQDAVSGKYNITKRRFRKILVENNIEVRDHSHKKRKYTVDENYFDNIDSANKAYILGLLYSDGCNYTKTNSIIIALQKADSSLLDKVKNELGSNHKIYIKELNKKNKNWQDSYILTIVNKHMSNRLNELGVVPRKSLILTFPDYLDDKLIPHFIRGYLDGDGHINWGGSNFITICSTLSFCEKLQNICKEKVGIESSILYTANKNTSTRILNICGKKKMFRFLNYIYKDADIYMDRKYNLYKEICSCMDNLC